MCMSHCVNSNLSTFNYNPQDFRLRPSNIECFTVTSHTETRARLLRLVGKTVKLAAIFVVFTL